MLNGAQKEDIIALTNSSLDIAEGHWENGGHLLVNKSMASTEEFLEHALDSVPSKIPGHPFVKEDETIIDEFIAFIVDIRGSTDHLLCDISKKKAKVTLLQRVFYETSALLPALSFTINLGGGGVTEYLGDGVLALFRIENGNYAKGIYSAHAAAKNCINETRNIVNEILSERYNLPPLDIGIGLGLSRTIVTLIGLNGEKHAKAFGECIYRASKLSGKPNYNSIFVDENLESKWPTEKGGTIKFSKKILGNVIGYEIEN